MLGVLLLARPFGTSGRCGCHVLVHQTFLYCYKLINTLMRYYCSHDKHCCTRCRPNTTWHNEECNNKLVTNLCDQYSLKQNSKDSWIKLFSILYLPDDEVFRRPTACNLSRTSEETELLISQSLFCRPSCLDLQYLHPEPMWPCVAAWEDAPSHTAVVTSDAHQCTHSPSDLGPTWC